MAQKSSQPRLPTITNPSADAADTLAKAAAHDGQPHNAALTLAYNARLLKRFAILAGYFLTHAQLPRQDVELITLRTAWRVRSEYYFGHHVLLGAAAGLSEDQIRATADVGQLSGRDARLASIVDEIVDTGDLSDATWAAVTEFYDDEKIMEAVLLVGFYQMVGGYANSFGLEREPRVPGWEFLGDAAKPS